MKNKQEKIIKINNLLLERYGEPFRQKNLPGPVDMLIATILSQNTNDANSFRAYNNLKANINGWEDIVDIKQQKLEKIISVAGLAKQKAAAIKNFIKTNIREQKKISLDYVRDMNEQDAISNLTRFKGVGVKTASCVLLFALDRNVCPVDTHVHRIVNRLGIVEATTPDKTFYQLNENFPEKIAHQFHTNLIKLGREICKPAKPSCAICPIKKHCVFTGKNFDKNITAKKREFMLLDNVEPAGN